MKPELHRPPPALKRYGQHFLKDGTVIEKIVRLAMPDQGDLLLEIGPGRGALTRRLLEEVGSLVAVEIDRKLADQLRTRFTSDQLRVVEADILRVDFSELLSAAAKKFLFIVGNLPYNITAPLLFKLLENAELINKALLMVQREVAERLVATPGTKAYGVLSVLLGIHADMSMRIQVGPRAFKPIPNVASAVIEVDFHHKDRFEIQDFGMLHRLVRACFGQRRKMLRNSLPAMMAADRGLPVGEIKSLTGIELSRRPETLTLEEFAKLANAFSSILRDHPSAATRSRC